MISADEFNPTVVFYHHPCSDGFTAAWCAQRYSTKIQLIPYDHQDPIPPEIKGARVVMIDCCFPREELLRLRGMTQDLLVLDHHKTNQDACGDLQFCHFEQNRSGAGLAWAFFFPTVPPPPLIFYVQDQDLHTGLDSGTRDFISSLYRRGLSFDWWEEVANMSPEALQKFMSDGVILREHFSHLMDEMLERAFSTTILGYPVCCANAPFPFHSAVANRLAFRDTSVAFGATFGFDRPNRVRMSFRSRPGGVHVNEIAARLGQGVGGGHDHAAGVALTVERFLEILGS